MNKKVFLAVATLVGSIVGVGIFGLPYVIAQVGFWPGIFYFLILSSIILFLHLMFGEVILRTESIARMPGYSKKYVGKKGKIISSISVFIGISASLMAYIVAGGEFLSNILNNSFFVSSVILWLILSFGIILGIKNISRFEFFMLIFFILILGIIFFISLPHIDSKNLSGFYPENIFLPYGVILFSLVGISAIPTVREILRGNEKYFKKSIFLGTLIPIIFYLIFIFSVIGVCGNKTSQEAITGLSEEIKSNLIILGSIFGILAVSTSFLTVGIYLRDVLIYDFKIKKNLAIAFVIFTPLLGILFGRDYLVIIMGFIGSIFAGMEDVVLIQAFRNAKKQGDRKPEYQINIPDFVLFLISIIFIGAFIYQIISFF